MSQMPLVLVAVKSADDHKNQANWMEEGFWAGIQGLGRAKSGGPWFRFFSRCRLPWQIKWKCTRWVRESFVEKVYFNEIRTDIWWRTKAKGGGGRDCFSRKFGVGSHVWLLVPQSGGEGRGRGQASGEKAILWIRICGMDRSQLLPQVQSAIVLTFIQFDYLEIVKFICRCHCEVFLGHFPHFWRP